jgi:hypothetical protein
MKKYTLSQALILICLVRNIKEQDITSICFEDGSGNKFIYKSNGEDTYINLSNITFSKG